MTFVEVFEAGYVIYGPRVLVVKMLIALRFLDTWSPSISPRRLWCAPLCYVRIHPGTNSLFFCLRTSYRDGSMTPLSPLSIRSLTRLDNSPPRHMLQQAPEGTFRTCLYSMLSGHASLALSFVALYYYIMDVMIHPQSLAKDKLRDSRNASLFGNVGFVASGLPVTSLY